MFRFLLALSLVSVPAFVHAEQASPPEVLFHLDFENGFNAQAKGTGAPESVGKAPRLVPGQQGLAASFEKGEVLAYKAAGNLNKDEGSLSIWFQTPVDGLGEPASGRKHTLFVEDGPYDQRASNTLWVWFHEGRGLRGDMRDPRDRYLYMNGLQHWKKGEWHHLVFTWNSETGTQAYLDGEWAAAPVTSSNWTPKFYDRFFIGAADAKGSDSWGSAIDEVTIFDRELTEDEVREEFLKLGTLEVRTRLFESYLTAGREGFARIEFYNPADSVAEVSGIGYRLLSDKGEEVAKGRLADQSVPSQERVLLQVPLTASTPGDYRLELSYTEDDKEYTDGMPVHVYSFQDETDATPVQETLIVEVDVAATEPIAETAPTKVVESPLGNYREAGSKRNDRFAVTFPVRAVNEPHVAVITYPDDKARTMEMMLQDLSGEKDFQAQIGVLTGDEYPVSDTMREQRILFWPLSKRQSFIFMTAEEGRPAAVESIKVYQLDRVPPPEPVSVFEGSIPARQIGIYYEDPVLNQSFGESAQLDGYGAAVTKLMDYMQSFGQGTLSYPLVWYRGALYGSVVEPVQQQATRPHPENYPEYLLRRLDARGITFEAGLHLHVLPSLQAEEIDDMSRINSGEETVLNMRSDGKLWHGKYHGSDPGYNPLDPRVQQGVTDIVEEIVEWYGDDPGFLGVSLVLARVKIYAFGSAESGYNDFNLQAFQRDTGINIPAYAPGKPGRFAASYQWLKGDSRAWEAWIAWRCEQLHAHYQRMADMVTAKNPKLKLTLNLFTPRSDYVRMSDYLNDDPVQAWREQGIDPALYAGDENIALSYTLVPADYRWRLNREDTKPDVVSNRTLYVAPESMEFMEYTPNPEAVIHDRYWEDAVGRTDPMTGLPVPEYTWRVTTFNGAGRNALEPYVVALNNFDALRITKGGFLIGSLGWESEIGEFSRAYRALPAIRFDDVPGLEDPVRVREKMVDGKLYFYVLNRLPEPVEVGLTLSDVDKVTNLSTGSPKALPKGELAVSLKPFELRSFAASGGHPRVSGGRTIISDDLVNALKEKMENAISQTDALQSSYPDKYERFAPYAKFAAQCWEDGDYARLNLLLQEQWAVEACMLEGSSSKAHSGSL